MQRFVLLFAFALSQLTGCFPFAVPPARLSIGPAVRQGDLGDSAGETSNGSLVAFRGGIHPLGATKDGARRVLDVGLGYGAEGSSGNDNSNDTKATTLHGPYLELGAYPVRVPLNDNLGLRVGATSTLDVLFREGSNDAGVGLSLGPLFELTGNASGPFASTNEEGKVLVGAASGYWAVGLFGSASVRKFDERYSSSFTGGISVRIPLAFGVACCAIPDFSGGDNASSSRSSSSSSRPARLRANPKPAK